MAICAEVRHAPVHAVATRYGLWRETVSRILRRYGVADMRLGRKPPRRDLAREAQVLEWIEGGKTLAEIGRRLGVSRERVRQIVQQAAS